MPTTSQSARERAFDRLMRIEHSGAYVSRTASGDLNSDEAREERQSSEYVGGVTRQRRWLDFLIDHFYQGDAAELEAPLRQILRIGLYDLLVLDTPGHAAVHESVELSKRRVRPRAAGLVNGILRSAQRARDRLPSPDSGDKAANLAVRYSQPDWIVRRWLEQFGEDEVEELLEAANQRPVYGVRVNTLRLDREAFTAKLDEIGVAWKPSPYLDDFVRVEHIQPILRAGMLEDGTCAVQDESAALVVRLLDPQPGDSVIDCTAAPGGKSIYAALRMGNEGHVLAIDIHEKRVDLIRRAAEAHGVHIVETLATDLRGLATAADHPPAHRVLLDAPCSGLGVLSKRADLRWHRSEDDLIELCALQDELLDAAAQLVSAGGVLAYSTCTIDQQENQARIESFLSRHSAFALESAKDFVPSEMLTEEGFFLALPHRHGTDGAFGARLRRK